MFWKLKYKTFLIKGLNFYLTKKKHTTVKNLNNYLGYKLNNNYILNLNEMIFWTYILIFFLQNALRKNAKVLFATKYSFQQKVFDTLIENSSLQFQLLKVFTKWVGGCLSNFLAIRWFYFFNRIKFYKNCPDILILLEKKAANPLISEAYTLNIPVISYTGFSTSDIQVSYLLAGGNLGLESKKNNFFFFIYILKNMLNLESSLKKKTLIKPRVVRGKRKKAFVRVKKNKAYRLFGSRSFNIWRSHLRFTLKLKLLKIKFQLIEKLLLRNFKMNKHFFKKRSTLSYVKKLKSHSYLVKCRKNIRFFFIIERRLLVVLARLYITRIVAQDQLKFLILNGYISVDNEIVKNPYYLAPHKAIIRILKTIPRSLSKVPKTLITINLRWLYFKRCRKLKRKMWRVKGRRRPWLSRRHKKHRFKRKFSKKQTPKNAEKKRRFWAFKKASRRRFLHREPRGRFRRFKWLGRNYRRNKDPFYSFPSIRPSIIYKIPLIFFFRLKKNPKNYSRTNKRKWFLFCSLISRVDIFKQRSKLLNSQNKYSTLKSWLIRSYPRIKKRTVDQKEGPYLSRKWGQLYKYSIFLKSLVFNLGKLPFSKGVRKPQVIQRNKFFSSRRSLRKLNLKKKFFKGKGINYSFFFLKFRKKKYRRRSSKSLSRKFFTNIWLVAFIFIRPIKIKKLWYSKLVTKRVLSFLCTKFW